MRHGNKINHLGRKTAHRNSMLANMANSLIEHKRINTTYNTAKVAKKKTTRRGRKKAATEEVAQPAQATEAAAE